MRLLKQFNSENKINERDLKESNPVNKEWVLLQSKPIYSMN